jgi:hypothetical protein
VREALSHQGSTVLASLSLLCLLLAATRATISRAHPQAMQAGAVIGVLPAGHVGVPAPAEEECVSTPGAAPLPAPVSEPAPRIATLVPGAPPEPVRRETTDDHDRDRRRVIKRPTVPERGPCDPPFIVDESGIRRIKPNCL